MSDSTKTAAASQQAPPSSQGSDSKPQTSSGSGSGSGNDSGVSARDEHKKDNKLPTYEADPLDFSTPHADVKGAFPHSDDVTEESTRVCAELILKDAEEHHVFFNDKGFHNHLIHQVVADWSMGATPSRLRDIFDKLKPTMRDAGPKGIAEDFDYVKCLGKEEYYQSYFAFFKQQVSERGIKDTVQHYIFRSEGSMLVRLVSGAYHPMIHLGYGVELACPTLVAEGLAQCAVHGPSARALFPEGVQMLRALRIYEQAGDKKQPAKTALDLASKLREDSRLDDAITFDESPKFKKLLAKSKPVDVILEYVDAWRIESHDHDHLVAKAGELMALGAAVYAGPQRREKAACLDFFLMHALTSSLFLPAYVELLAPEDSVKLMTAKLAVDLAYYVSRNRPKLDIDQFRGVDALRTWGELFDAAIAHDDEHVPKAVRGLLQALIYGGHYVDDEDADKIFRGMAELTLEADGEWNQDGIGFDQVWKDVPDHEPRAKQHGKASKSEEADKTSEAESQGDKTS